MIDRLINRMNRSLKRKSNVIDTSYESQIQRNIWRQEKQNQRQVKMMETMTRSRLKQGTLSVQELLDAKKEGPERESKWQQKISEKSKELESSKNIEVQEKLNRALEILKKINQDSKGFQGSHGSQGTQGDPESEADPGDFSLDEKNSGQGQQEKSIESEEVIRHHKALSISDLSPSQKKAFDLIVHSLNRYTFITGGGGRGKSGLIMCIIHHLKSIGIVNVTCTAATGKAALQIHGVTICSLLKLPKHWSRKSIQEIKFLCMSHAQQRHT